MTRSGWLWPMALVGLLVASAGANVAFLVIAARDPSFAVEPDYYQKALAWDRTMAEAARSAALGWSVSVSAAPATGGVDLGVRIADARGAPVDGAHVSVEAFHNARASQVVTAGLGARGGGRYGAILSLARPGLWELRMRAVRGGEVFTLVLSRDLAPGPGRS